MCLQKNQVEWPFIAQFFDILLMPRFKGFSACKEVLSPVSMMRFLRTKCISLEREKSCFPKLFLEKPDVWGLHQDESWKNYEGRCFYDMYKMVPVFPIDVSD